MVFVSDLLVKIHVYNIIIVYIDTIKYDIRIASGDQWLVNVL